MSDAPEHSATETPAPAVDTSITIEDLNNGAILAGLGNFAKGFWADVWSPSRAKKAYSAGTAAAGVAFLAGVGTIFQDGKITSGEVLTDIGAVVVGFVGAFVAAYASVNGKKS